MRRYLIPAAIALTGILGFCGISFAQCTGIPSANTVCAGPASGGAGQFSGRKLVPGDLPFTVPTAQTFVSGSGTYVPTSPAVRYIRVTMVAGGGGGGGAGSGTAGGNTSFADWTCIGGAPGAGPSGASGGVGGGGGGAPAPDGTGTLIDRQSGGNGQNGLANSSSGVVTLPVRGGSNSFGSQPAAGGGGFSGIATIATVGTPGSGGAGESISFYMTAAQIGAGKAWVVGAAGNGGASNPNVSVGGPGSAGKIRVEEFYN